MIRKRFIFYGRVQGVGFRYTAKHAADMFRCTGWVKNEYDGTVSMEIQGEENAINQVIHTISEGRFIQITGIDAREIPIDTDERSFGTRF